MTTAAHNDERRDYSPWADLDAHPNIDCRFGHIPVAGAWIPDLSTIVLCDGLDSVTQACVLTHELIHAKSTVVRGRNYQLLEESRVAAAAARLLIPIDRLRAGVAATYDETELAHWLGVDLYTLQARLAALSPAEYATLLDAA